jgi:N-acetylmuramoyl-L-alanine amidase
VLLAFSPDSPLTGLIVPSPNFGERKNNKQPDCIVLHYTGMTDCDAAVRWLADPVSQVSAHYVVRENGVIVQMVAEASRAWHAGQGSWQGEDDINSTSIGIEICNPGHDLKDLSKPYPDFAEAQIQSVIALVLNIVARRRLQPARVLAHSDLAPRRKVDPGEKFPWARLARHGLGLYVPPRPLRNGSIMVEGVSGKAVLNLKQRFKRLGFAVGENDIFDEDFTFVVKAFQRHWRPEKVDGLVDPSTRGTLADLLKMRG